MKISWIPTEQLKTKGRLGLCRAPGSESPTTPDDLDVLVAQGATQVVCLQEAHELSFLEPPETLEERQRSLQSRGIGFLHEPIEDYGAPSLVQAQGLASWIVEALERGEVVVVHCWAGLGRTGTIAACVLIALGFSAQEATSLVRQVRPGAIQSNVQEELVSTFVARPKEG